MLEHKSTKIFEISPHPAPKNFLAPLPAPCVRRIKKLYYRLLIRNEPPRESRIYLHLCPLPEIFQPQPRKKNLRAPRRGATTVGRGFNPCFRPRRNPFHSPSPPTAGRGLGEGHIPSPGLKPRATSVIPLRGISIHPIRKKMHSPTKARPSCPRAGSDGSEIPPPPLPHPTGGGKRMPNLAVRHSRGFLLLSYLGLHLG